MSVLPTKHQPPRRLFHPRRNGATASLLPHLCTVSEVGLAALAPLIQVQIALEYCSTTRSGLDPAANFWFSKVHGMKCREARLYEQEGYD